MPFKVLERDIERAFVDAMREQGILKKFAVVKLNLMGFRGWPDRLIFGDKRFVLFIEFKRPGEEPSPHQSKIHRVLRGWGFTVLVIDDKGTARGIAKKIIAGNFKL